MLAHWGKSGTIGCGVWAVNGRSRRAQPKLLSDRSGIEFVDVFEKNILFASRNAYALASAAHFKRPGSTKGKNGRLFVAFIGPRFSNYILAGGYANHC